MATAIPLKLSGGKIKQFALTDTTYNYARVSGSDVTRTAQTLADITGLSIALVASATYILRAVLFVTSSSAAGNQYGIQFSAAGATVEGGIGGTLAAATARFDRVTAFNTAASAMVVLNGSGMIIVEAQIVVGANAGNLTIQHLKTTSGTSTVRIGSYMRADRVV